MKKVTLIAAFFVLVLSGFSTPVAAGDCGTCWTDTCQWSMCDGKVKVGAEWLYWKTQQDNMPLVGTLDKTLVQNNVFAVHSKQPTFDYTSGFRVNLGYELPCNSWEANVIYTYMPTKSSFKTVVADDNIGIEVLGNDSYLLPIANDTINTFTQKWSLDINNIDVDIARTITFNECISIRPHAGFRSLWYKETQRAVAAGDFFSQASFTDYEAVATNKFQGYGVEAGLWGSWQVGCGVSIIGHFGGSILYSKFSVSQLTEGSNTVNDEKVLAVTFNGIDKIKTATPTVEYFLGLQYADQMCDMSFAIRAGWEQQVIFYTNRIAGNGNLSMQGLTLGLEVGF